MIAFLDYVPIGTEHFGVQRTPELLQARTILRAPQASANATQNLAPRTLQLLRGVAALDLVLQRAQHRFDGLVRDRHHRMRAGPQY
ncbi:hypothetical protein D3C81_2173420 [compost metagenome]